MRLRPTLRASHLTVFGIVSAALGIVSTHAPMVAYGAALLSGVALSRALTRASVARARTAGFEMLWSGPDTLLRVTRLSEVVVKAELRNRDSLPTRFRKLTVFHAPSLDVRVTPESGEVPGNGTLTLELKIRPTRVGLHGLHSITLHTIRAPGLFTVPLAFSNPLVLEVLPKVRRMRAESSLGGGSSQVSPLARRGRRTGDGAELRELREHRPGDPYKRIAWKASARRGRLLVIENEQEESDRVWVLIDASIDSCSGAMGKSALDRAVDEAASTIESHLAHGDSVGLAIVGARVLCKIPPARGPKHGAKLISALTFETHTADSDRSDWDETDIAKRVLEHASSLDVNAAGLRSNDYNLLTEHAARILRRAPARAPAPWAPIASDRLFRQYLLSFGIQPPPRGSSDRHQTERELAHLVVSLVRSRPRPTLLYLFGAPPSFETPKQYVEALRSVPKRRIEVRFVPMTEFLSRSETTTLRERVALDALGHRQKMLHQEGILQLGRLGVTVQHEKPRRRRLPGLPTAPSPTVTPAETQEGSFP